MEERCHGLDLAETVNSRWSPYPAIGKTPLFSNGGLWEVRATAAPGQNQSLKKLPPKQPLTRSGCMLLTNISTYCFS